MIPCIKDKCLKYPVCKSKILIDCSLLRDHYRLIIEWNDLHEYFPNLKTLISYADNDVFYPTICKPSILKGDV